MIDKKGFRKNIGIILVNENNHVFWGRRVGQDAWQFPQGGVNANEELTDALYRELMEEVGLEPQDVEQMAVTQSWISYRIPQQYLRKNSKPVCVGQKQKWFLLRLTASEQKLRFDKGEVQEFDSWRWVDYWYPVKNIIRFKRKVYLQALTEFAPILGIENGD